MAATPLLFGLRDLFGQDSGDPAPLWYRAALTRMKETRRHGVVLVAPADTKGRIAFGETLRARLDADDPETIELFCETVVIALRPEIAARVVKRSKSEENRFLLDPDGRQVAADRVPAEALGSSRSFAESFGAFVRGSDGERLRVLADSIRVSAEVKSALSKLDSEDWDEREEAVSVLVRHADAIAPVLVRERIVAGSDERRLRIRMVLRRWFREQEPLKSGARLPYGVVRVDYLETCGSFEDEEDGVGVACGRARPSREARKFLRFLTK